MNSMHNFSRGVCLLMTLFLAGCGGTNQDLYDFIEGVKQGVKPQVEPLPILKPYEQFIYEASHLREPFEDMLKRQEEEQAKASQRGAGDSKAPDSNRRKEPLESFPVDSLKMLGTLSDESSLWAIVIAPDETVNRVVTGNYMGKNHGKITKVTDTQINITEVVRDGVGGWIQREVVVPLTEKEGN